MGGPARTCGLRSRVSTPRGDRSRKSPQSERPGATSRSRSALPPTGRGVTGSPRSSSPPATSSSRTGPPCAPSRSSSRPPSRASGSRPRRDPRERRRRWADQATPRTSSVGLWRRRGWPRAGGRPIGLSGDPAGAAASYWRTKVRSVSSWMSFDTFRNRSWGTSIPWLVKVDPSFARTLRLSLVNPNFFWSSVSCAGLSFT